MPDLLSALAELGASARTGFWLPVFVWTALALAADLALRAVRASAPVGLATRGAVLALLPLLLVAPALLAPAVPSFTPTIARSAPLALPTPADVAPAEPMGASGPSIASETATLRKAPAPTAAAVWTVERAIGLATALLGLASLVALAALAGGLGWLTRYRRALDRAGASVQADADAIARRLGVRQPVAVAVAESAASPFTLGWRRPVVSLPAGLAGEPLELALAHELAHVRESHYGWHLAERVLRAAFVWHPLVWVLGRGLALDRERVADAAVVRLWPERAERYGRLLVAFAAHPSPPLALGASSSTLVHRLTAMTRLRPDRRRLARLAGLAMLVVPLVAAAAAIPDRQPDAPPEAERTEAVPFANPIPADATPADATLADATPSDDVPPVAPDPERVDAAAQVPQAQPIVSLDTLNQYIERRHVQSNDGQRSIALRVKDDTPDRIVQAIADYYSDGDERGELVVRSRDIEIRRTTLREGAFPPPPPPPPAPEAPAPPPAPPASPAGEVVEVPVRSSPGGLSYGDIVRFSDDRLDRYVTVLQDELAATNRQLGEIRRAGFDATPEQKAEGMRLNIRKEAVEQRLRTGLAIQEERRLDALVDG